MAGLARAILLLACLLACFLRCAALHCTARLIFPCCPQAAGASATAGTVLYSRECAPGSRVLPPLPLAPRIGSHKCGPRVPHEAQPVSMC